MKSKIERKKYYIKAYGCQMNKSDGERTAAMMQQAGYSETSRAEEADLVLLIACSVRQSAVDRIYGQAAKASREKKSGRRTVFALTGCLLEADRKALAEKFDIVFDIKDLPKLPEMLYKFDQGKKEAGNSDSESYFHITAACKDTVSAYVPIMTGCDNFCSYCVVPYVRGREESRPANEIIEEIRKLLSAGRKEIILLGQNVNSYRSEPEAENPKLKAVDFPGLLRLINDIPGKFRIRFMTSHPKDMSDGLIAAVAECDKACEYIHLPAQSGDSAVLKKMNRKYTANHYERLVGKIRNRIPGVAVSTDIIVGFPGETEKQFENTAGLMERIGFDMAYIAQYSPRPQTAAYGMGDDVPREEKKRREKILTEILEKSALENNLEYVGREVEILIDSIKCGFLSGKTRTFKNTRIPAKKGIKAGDFIKARITGATAWGLEGEIP